MLNSSNKRMTALLATQAMEAARMYGDYEDAVRLLTQALQYDPSSGGLFQNRGMANCRLERWSEAVADFSRAIALSPHPSAYEQRGMAYYSMGDRDSAKADWAQALLLDHRRTFALINLAWLAIEERQFDPAIKLCSHAIRIEPTLAKAYENRARAYLEMGDQARGLADWQTSRELVASGRDSSNVDQNE